MASSGDKGADTERQKRLRLALSYREKARRLDEQCEQALADGTITPERHESLHRLYAEHQALAESAVARVRQQLRDSIGDWEHLLRRAEVEQAKLARRADQGELGIDHVNERSRALHFEAQALKERIEDARGLLHAEVASELGGFIDRPLDGYGVSDDGPLPAPPPAVVMVSFLLPLAAGASVFLPWLGCDGRSYSLLRLAAAVSALRGTDVAYGLFVNLAWLAFAALPLAAAPAMAKPRSRKAGWTATMVGALTLCAGLSLPLMAGLAQSDAGSLLDLLKGFRFGSALYSICGGGLVVIGALRFSKGARSLLDSMRAAALAGGVVTVVLVVVFLLAFLGSRGPRPHFSLNPINPRAGIVELICKNRGSRDMVLYIPASEQGTEPGEAFSGEDIYAFVVLVRKAGEDRFSECPFVQGAWRVQGIPVLGSQRFVVEPGLTVAARFDGSALRREGVDAAEVLVQVVRGDGTEVDAFPVNPGPVRPYRRQHRTPSSP